MAKEFKRRFSFEVDANLAKANDTEYRKLKKKIVFQRSIPLIFILFYIVFSFSISDSGMIKVSFIFIGLFFWIISGIRRDIKKLRNTEFILKHGFLIPGIVIEINNKEVDILTLVRFVQNSHETWSFFSIKTKLNETSDTLNIGDHVPISCFIAGEDKDIMYSSIHFAPLYYGTKSKERLQDAIDRIDEFEWNILERNPHRYLSEPKMEPQLLAEEEVYRYSLDKI